MQLINNLSLKITQHQESIKTAIDRVLHSAYLILGPECKRFEQAFADYVGVAHCVGVANGTDALELALKALGIQSGDTVATVANAGMYTTSALLAIGATPYFLEVDLESKNTTLAEVIRAVNTGVKVVVITHLYGLAVSEIAQIADYCAQKEIPLLEDCAQAHGARIQKKHIGSFGDAACFSFYPTKNLGALGDGGAVVSNKPEVAEKVRLLRQYGWKNKYQVELSGARNSRLDEIQAAILSEFLPHLDTSNARRREIAHAYNERIQHPHIITMPAQNHEEYVAHLYVIRSTYRNTLREHLQQQSIASDIHYPIPDYRQPIFHTRFSDIYLPNTETLSNEILTLPCYPEMNDSEVDHVISAINSWCI
ncbi:MAG: DegT/DnrJ/EryC1/StrS family aminotransferase [Legionellaceae bacterium]|nr:DegT/DnrJ/EryC1/StrS family aminotransferase [Legionellaceae bacterium]